MSTNSSPSGAEPLRVYRTLPARVIGAVLLAAALVLTVMTVIDVMDGHRQGVIAPVAFIAGVAAIAWVLFLRPKAVLYADRVELTNILTHSVVPFSEIQDVTHRWSLELNDTAGHRHSAWAVPVRREMTRRRNIDDFAETTRKRGSERMTAQGAADEVLRAIDRWDLAGGQRSTASTSGSPAATRPVVTQRLSWPAVVAIAVACSLAMIAIVT